MWIPHKPYDLVIEQHALEITEAARDAALDCPEGSHRVVGVKFKSSEIARRVVECLQEKYAEVGGATIRIELFH